MTRNFFSIRIPVLYLFILVFLCAGTFALMYHHLEGNAIAAAPATQNKDSVPDDCRENAFRIKGFQYVKPLVSEARGCESPKYAGLKSAIKNYIDDATGRGEIKCASVYLENLSGDEGWTAISPDIEYHPGSLGKVPLLITYLKKAETSPGLLDKEIKYDKDAQNIPGQYFIEDSIRKGHKYTIRELLYHMIANSDNHAAVLLMDKIDFADFTKTYTDLGMNGKLIEENYKFKAREYSLFLEALYNVGYLNMSSSEYAMSLLAQCKFREGILKQLPEHVKAIHKFGECRVNGIRELHESAIIYLDDGNTYLLTIMTKGDDMTKLSTLMGNISKMTYDRMMSGH